MRLTWTNSKAFHDFLFRFAKRNLMTEIQRDCSAEIENSQNGMTLYVSLKTPPATTFPVPTRKALSVPPERRGVCLRSGTAESDLPFHRTSD